MPAAPDEKTGNPIAPSAKYVITAKVPLSSMFGYVNNLRSLSQGRASYSMEFECYNSVPANVAEEIMAKKS